MWDRCLEIIVAITCEHLKYNIILFINIKMVIVKLSNCNKNTLYETKFINCCCNQNMQLWNTMK